MEEASYKVVMNHEGQYSIWPAGRSNPRGWQDVGRVGQREECLKYIDEIWVDMRPRRLREAMEQYKQTTDT